MTEKKYMKVVVGKDVPGVSIRYSVEFKVDKKPDVNTSETNKKKKKTIVLMMNPASAYYKLSNEYNYEHGLYYLDGSDASEDHKKSKPENIDPTTKKIVKEFENVILVNVSPFVQSDIKGNKQDFLDISNNFKNIREANIDYIKTILSDNKESQLVLATGELKLNVLKQDYFNILHEIDNMEMNPLAFSHHNNLLLTKTGYTNHPKRRDNIDINSNDVKLIEFYENYNKSMYQLFKRDEK